MSQQQHEKYLTKLKITNYFLKTIYTEKTVKPNSMVNEDTKFTECCLIEKLLISLSYPI